MALHKHYDEKDSISEVGYDDEEIERYDDLERKKKVRRMLEDRLEAKRLKKALEDELDDDFDWDEIDR